MTPPTIEALIAYVRAKSRPNQIDGRLLSHIDALQAEIAELRDALDHQTAMRQVAEGTMPMLTDAELDGPCECGQMTVITCDAAMPSRRCGLWDAITPAPTKETES